MFQMTAKYLQEHHKDTFESFFQSHDMVVSTSHVFRWGHAISRGKTYISIKQKLPGRMYCGVNMKDDGIVSFKNILFYDQVSNTYIEHTPEQIIGQDKMIILLDVLTYVFGKIGLEKGLQISILSDYPRGHGFGFIGILFTLLSCIIKIFAKELTLETLEDYDNFLLSKCFRDIIKIASFLDTKCMGTVSSLGHHVSLSTDTFPVCMLGGSELIDTYEECVDDNKKDTNSFFLTSLKDLFGIDMSTYDIPLDYGIISFGVGYRSGDTRNKFDKLNVLYEDTRSFLADVTKKHNFDSSDLLNMNVNVKDMSRFLYINILKQRENMMKHKTESYHVDSFIQSIINSGMYNALIEGEKKNMIDMYYRFDELKQFDHEKIGLVPASSAKLGGAFLFVCPRNVSRGTVENILKKLHASGYENAHYSYLSWRDGTSDQGFSIDQYISENVYSDFIQPGSVMFRGGDSRSYIGAHEDVLDKENKGLILDRIYNKIYLDGRKLTTKDLCSQSSTVEILSKLLERNGKYINNTDLPLSSYSKNKNEMLGKIVLPFIDLVKKNYSVDLKLQCTGSIYDFQMRFINSNNDFLHVIDRLD